MPDTVSRYRRRPASCRVVTVRVRWVRTVERRDPVGCCCDSNSCRARATTLLCYSPVRSYVVVRRMQYRSLFASQAENNDAYVCSRVAIISKWLLAWTEERFCSRGPGANYTIYVYKIDTIYMGSGAERQPTNDLVHFSNKI